MEEQGQQRTEDQAEPGLLYHYTTLDGLLGILDKGELWASGILYLNDTSEFKAATTAAFDAAMTDSQSGEVSSGLKDYSSLFCYSAAHPESVYTVSFSAEAGGDDLSQWRAYSGPYSGVSLGFSSQYLRSISKRFLSCDENIGWIGADQDALMKCEYYQYNVAVDPSNAIYDELRRTMAIEDSHTRVLRFARYAATLKHEKFRAEQEWRIVLIWGGWEVPVAVKFRRVRSLVAPYAPIPLKHKDQPIQIDRIVVGPTPHRDEAKSSIEMLLKRYHVKYKEVVSSEVPYRNW